MDTETQEPAQPTIAVSRRGFLGGLAAVAVGASAGAGFVVAIATGGEAQKPDGASEAEPVASPEPAAVAGEAAGPGPPPPQPQLAVATSYPKVRVGSLSSLAVGDVVDFEYPTEGSQASLLRLGRRADGGIGPDEDIVAFTTDCTHMGCPLRGLYNPEYAIFGPCPCHFTTFDPTHRGMVVLGQATENLPQILLDIEGDDIVAVGTLGILYGFRDNLADVPLVEGL
ncbi:MAG: arsenate reductase (azurin) small subunit [Gaiellales bacterium]